jgi:phosphatidylethanolamine/phosphatidyl-N-methylethanolamine N-methyltransferase
MQTKAAPTSPVGNKRNFLMQFLRRPAEIGAFAPSSRHLARRMISGIGIETAKVVVEYGPGTGAVTGHILSALSPSAKFFAIEINPVFADAVRRRNPGASIHTGSVADIESFCAAEGVAPLKVDGAQSEGGIDLIISGLPWASFPESLQRSILDATMRVLKPGGLFVTFGYHVGLLTPAGQRFAKLMRQYFSSTSRSWVIWRNLPPAFVVRCRK